MFSFLAGFVYVGANEAVDYPGILYVGLISVVLGFISFRLDPPGGKK
jgi:hypothetical protein